MSDNEITYEEAVNGLFAKDWKGKLVGKTTEDHVVSLNIVVFGATGGTGLEVVKEALKRGHKGYLLK
jgi:hypothetical protein